MALEGIVAAPVKATLESFDARYGWAPVSEGRAVDWLWSVELPFEAAELWPYVADTSLFNRALGLPPIVYREEGEVRVGRTRYFGVAHEWVEEPWTWVAGRWVECVRRFREGWIEALKIRAVLEPLATGGTRIYWRSAIVPRGALARLAMGWAWSGVQRRFEEVHRGVAAAMKAERAALRQEVGALEEGARRRLEGIGEGLVSDGVDAEVVGRLVRLVAEGDFVDVERLRPLALAKAWGVEPRAVLRAFLHATRRGALTLTWDAVCPLCRGVRVSAGSLGELPGEASCEPCRTTFRMDTVHAVEVAFHVHPSIRVVEARAYCAAEPSHKAHVKLQLRLGAGEEEVRATSLAEGRYRLRRLGEALEGAVEVEVEGASGARELTWRASARAEGEVVVGEGPVVHLVNDLEAAQTFVIESLAWAEDILQPGVLFNLQDFRDLFVDQVVAVGMQIAVGEQTILFTDIVGSTAMYADMGDAEAFAAVRAHFVEVYEVVRRHDGAVVKTIGDAAMASFLRPEDAVAAAAAMVRCFPPDRADSPVRLRVSIFTGPCIAVNLNNGIDFFGSTVNIAAKLQSVVGGGEVVFPAWFCEGEEGVRGLEGEAVERLTFTVPKLGRSVEVVRWGLWGPRATG